MDAWAADYGVQRAPGFQLTSQDGLDWSVVTNEPLAEDTTVLAIPSNMIFSSSQARQEFYNEAAEDLLDRLGTADKIPQFYLFLNILSEYERGVESPWFPWLNSLPRWFNNGSAMTRKSCSLYIMLSRFRFNHSHVFVVTQLIATNVSLR